MALFLTVFEWLYGGFNLLCLLYTVCILLLIWLYILLLTAYLLNTYLGLFALAFYRMADTICYNDCLITVDSPVIQCDLCHLWIHKICAAAHDPNLDELLKSKKKVSIPFWHCRDCGTLWKSLRQGHRQAMPIVSTDRPTPDAVLENSSDVADCDCAHVLQISELKETLLEKETTILELKALLAEFVDMYHSKNVLNTEINLLKELDGTVDNSNNLHSRPASSVLGEAHSPTRLDIVERDIAALKSKFILQPQPSLTNSGDIRAEECVVNKSLPSLGDSLNGLKCKWLVLGDSLVSNVHRWLPDSTYVAWRSGATIASVTREIMVASINTDIQVVIVHIGGNDLSYMESPDHVIGDLWNLIDVLREKFPNSKLIMDGILWRKGFTYNFMFDLNQGIAWLARCLGIGFADPNLSIFRTHFSYDCIHLNSVGNKIFGGYLKNLLSVL